MKKITKIRKILHIILAILVLTFVTISFSNNCYELFYGEGYTNWILLDIFNLVLWYSITKNNISEYEDFRYIIRTVETMTDEEIASFVIEYNIYHLGVSCVVIEEITPKMVAFKHDDKEIMVIKRKDNHRC